jgi:hypothetical protein
VDVIRGIQVLILHVTHKFVLHAEERVYRSFFLDLVKIPLSMDQKASNAHIMSCLITGQAVWRKRAVKPSGPVLCPVVEIESPTKPPLQ